MIFKASDHSIIVRSYLPAVEYKLEDRTHQWLQKVYKGPDICKQNERTNWYGIILNKTRPKPKKGQFYLDFETACQNKLSCKVCSGW